MWRERDKKKNKKMNKDFTTVSLLSEIATYASCIIPDVLARDLFHKAFDMFLKAYRFQAESRVQNREDDVAHMETCQCFVADDFLLVSISTMFHKIIQNRDFLGFWDDNPIVDTMEKKQVYTHMTFVILCDITVRFWDDHVIEMSLHESYIGPSISRWHADRDRKNARKAFNQHYMNVFSWIDCNADIFSSISYDRLEKPRVVIYDETCPMDVSEHIDKD